MLYVAGNEREEVKEGLVSLFVIRRKRVLWSVCGRGQERRKGR